MAAWRGWLGMGALCAIWIGIVGCPGSRSPLPPVEVNLRQVASGLTAPLAIVASPDETGRMFVVTQVGRIRIFDSNTETLREGAFLDLGDALVRLNDGYDERGLLGLAFHPRFAENGRFFVMYNAPKGDDVDPAFDSELRISEFRVSADDPDEAMRGSERVLLRIGKPQFNHNGGQLAFGRDGYLYIGVGDGGGANDRGLGHADATGNAQSLDTLLGKILRGDVDGREPYGIPPDNPFVDTPGARSEIYAYGFRNPWRFSFDVDERGVERLFVGDVGQNLFEEVDIVEKGGNYGWNIREGARCFSPDSPGNPPEDCPSTGPNGAPLLDPIFAYEHESGISVIGGYVYRGSAAPQLAGRYVFGDFSTSFVLPQGRLYAAQEMAEGSWAFSEVVAANRASGRVDAFVYGLGEGPEGELYVVTNGLASPRGDSGAVWVIE